MSEREKGKSEVSALAVLGGAAIVIGYFGYRAGASLYNGLTQQPAMPADTVASSETAQVLSEGGMTEAHKVLRDRTWSGSTV
jgi:hypothetical protein